VTNEEVVFAVKELINRVELLETMYSDLPINIAIVVNASIDLFETANRIEKLDAEKLNTIKTLASAMYTSLRKIQVTLPDVFENLQILKTLKELPSQMLESFKEEIS
jgi:hypothetical protein